MINSRNKNKTFQPIYCGLNNDNGQLEIISAPIKNNFWNYLLCKDYKNALLTLLSQSDAAESKFIDKMEALHHELTPENFINLLKTNQIYFQLLYYKKTKYLDYINSYIPIDSTNINDFCKINNPEGVQWLFHRHFK
jgi:hypothetical protein